MRIATIVTAAALAAAVSAGAVFAKDEAKPFIRVPKSWDAAVEEAKTLKLPLVVHNHGWS